MFNDEVIFLEVSVPPCCSSVQLLGSLPILEVGVISEDGKWGFRPPQVVSPVCEGFHYCEKLSFVDVVISFGWCEGCRIECDWV